MRSLRKSYKKRLHRKIVKTRKAKNNKLNKSKRVKRGGSEKVKCCMCNKKTGLRNSLMPRVCLEKHGFKSHRICKNCWWDEKNGFARETGSHHCPGCKKGKSLTQINEDSDIIDLTGE
jgi:hypothetical protein